MMRGIRFELPNDQENFLEKNLENFDISNLFWQVLFSDTFTRTASKNDECLRKGDYDGLEFKKIMAKNNYIVHLGLLASSIKIEENVHDYASFMNSTAEFFVAIVDSIFVDVYAKNMETLAQFEKAARKHGFTNIEYFTAENDFFPGEWTA